MGGLDWFINAPTISYREARDNHTRMPELDSTLRLLFRVLEFASP